MKKRILSFLLVLCMLVAMVPVTAAVAEENGSTESQADVVYAENYLDLYVTEGLTVLFDANSLSGDMITFSEEANTTGTWYGYTVDAATGKLAKNESYVARPHGGAYNAETNPFGWQKLENGGIAWDEPESRNKNYYLHFSTDWLSDTFNVEVVFAPYLRNTTQGAVTPETIFEYTGEDTDFIYDEADALKKPVDAFGPVWEYGEYTDESTGDSYFTFGFKRSSTWNVAGEMRNKGNEITLTLNGYEPGMEITVKATYGSYVQPTLVDESGKPILDANGKQQIDTSKPYGYVRTNAVSVLGTVTTDEDGFAVLTAPIRGNYFEIILPEGVDIEKVEANICGNQYAFDQTIVIGNLYAMIWSNKLASNTWGNGFGMARWTVAKNSWEAAIGTPANKNGPANIAQLLYADYFDDTALSAVDHKIITLSVAATPMSYKWSYGSFSKNVALDTSKANEDGSYSGRNFKILQYMGGAVYGVRVYSEILNSDQKNQNYFADLAAIYDLDVTAIDLGKLDMYGYIFSYFASNYEFEGEDAAEMQAQLDEMLTWTANVAMTEYDALYVQNGLVGLYTAYNGDASVDMTHELWFAKIGAPAVIKSNGQISALADGVGTTRWNKATFDSNKGKTGISFPEKYAEQSKFTVDASIMFYALSDVASESGSYYVNATGHRVDLLAFTPFMYTNNPHMRALYTYANWGNNGGHNGRGNTIGLAGQTDGYRPSTVTYTNGKINSMVVSKNVGATQTDLFFSLNGNIWSNLSITAAQYATQISSYTPTEGKISFLNGAPGVIYAVRIYDRLLTDIELQQNQLVDILAYAGVDLDAIDFDAIMASAGIRGAVLQGGVGQTADAILGILDNFSVTPTMTDYDKLYVDRGLVALYSAYDTKDGTPDSLKVVDGKVTTWTDKINQYPATVTGNFVANYDNDGGFGLARFTEEEWATVVSGVQFSNTFADLEDFTVENVVRYRKVASTGNVFSGSAAGIRFDVIMGLVFRGCDGGLGFHVRTGISNTGWGGGGTANGSTSFRMDGNATPNTYFGNGYSLSDNKLVTHTFVKNNDGTNVKLAILMDGAVTNNAGFKNSGSITVAQYRAVKGTGGITTPVMSNLNKLSGTMYSVRVYSVELTAAEMKQNKLVDLLAYTGADLTNYPTEATELAMLANLIAEKGWSFNTADLKTKLEAAMSRGVTTVTYKNVLTGETIKSFLEIKGEYLTLPESFGNKSVVEWDVNVDDAVASDNVVYNAVVIEKPTANNGVSVRVDGEDVGLRFTTVLDKASYGDLTIKYGAKNVKLGMLVSTSAIVDKAGAFTKDAIDLYAAGNAGYVDIAINGYYKMTEGGDYELAGVLTNIKDSSLDAAKVKFVSVLYIEIDTDDDGVYDVTVYGSASAAKSVKDVADATKAAIDAADVDSGLTAEAEATFNTWYAAKFPTAE